MQGGKTKLKASGPFGTLSMSKFTVCTVQLYPSMTVRTDFSVSHDDCTPGVAGLAFYTRAL